jgi:hypothetical protein
MPLTLKVNFKKGWPSPSIVEKVANPASGVTTLEAGKIGRLNSTGQWVLGIAAVNQPAYVFRNDQGDPDTATNNSGSDGLAVQGAFGGVQGISLDNAIEFETVQYAGTPAIGDQLYADTDGLLKVAVNAAGTLVTASKVIVATVTRGVHSYQNSSYIQVVPDKSKRLSPAS